jgi:hypothetical protein
MLCTELTPLRPGHSIYINTTTFTIPFPVDSSLSKCLTHHLITHLRKPFSLPNAPPLTTTPTSAAKAHSYRSTSLLPTVLHHPHPYPGRYISHASTNTPKSHCNVPSSYPFARNYPKRTFSKCAAMLKTCITCIDLRGIRPRCWSMCIVCFRLLRWK